MSEEPKGEMVPLKIEDVLDFLERQTPEKEIVVIVTRPPTEGRPLAEIPLKIALGIK